MEDKEQKPAIMRPGYVQVPWSPGLSIKNGGILGGMQRAHQQMVDEGLLCTGCERMADLCQDERHQKRCAGCGEMVKKVWRSEDAEGRVKMFCAHCIDE